MTDGLIIAWLCLVWVTTGLLALAMEYEELKQFNASLKYISRLCDKRGLMGEDYGLLLEAAVIALLPFGGILIIACVIFSPLRTNK